MRKLRNVDKNKDLNYLSCHLSLDELKFLLVFVFAFAYVVDSVVVAQLALETETGLAVEHFALVGPFAMNVGNVLDEIAFARICCRALIAFVGSLDG